MIHTGTPPWAWLFVAITMVPPIAALGLLFILERVGPRPVKRVIVGETAIELWVKERKYPSHGEAVIIPVAPDLNMNVGIAKWVKDKTANRLQRDAQRAAPREPGTAFVGSGGKFYFKLAVLAVVMDDKKVTRPEWISTAITHGIMQAQEHDVRTIIVPDMTEDLLRQPKEITDAERNKTCGPIAKATLDGILKATDGIETIKIWVWRSVNLPVFVAEMERLQGAPVGKLATAH